MDYEKYQNKLPFATRRANPEKWLAYQLTNAAMKEQFKADLFVELGITDHPKREALFRLAWHHGHSAGHMAIFLWAQELAELL